MAVVYCSGDFAKLLPYCIKSFDKICSGEINFSELQNESKDFDSEIIPYTIKNKYFTADLHFKSHRSHQHPLFQDVLNEAECCILTTSTATGDETSLDEDISRVGQLAAELQIAVRLLVSIKNNQENEFMTNAQQENRLLWCLDHGFEYVEIDVLNPAHSHNLREKEGLPRLIEALNSNMWSNMERVVPSTSSSTSTRIPTTSAASATEKPSEEISSDCSSILHHPPPPPPPPETSTSSESLMASEQLPPTSSTTSASSSTIKDEEHKEDEILHQLLQSTQMKLPPSSTEDTEDEKLWDTFNDVISQARTIRNDAVSGNLSDDERRRRAADIAMRLCAAMDFGESSDDDEG